MLFWVLRDLSFILFAIALLLLTKAWFLTEKRDVWMQLCQRSFVDCHSLQQSIVRNVP